MSTKMTVHTSWDWAWYGKFLRFLDWHLYREMNDLHYHLELDFFRERLVINIKFWEYCDKEKILKDSI